MKLEVRPQRISEGFLFKFFSMKHSINCINHVYVNLSIEQVDENHIQISIIDSETDRVQDIILNSKGLFNLLGSLHHFQKQLKK
jgi:hypothetical protein